MSQASEIANRFDYATAQPRLYEAWLKAGLFHPSPDPARQPYTIVIPPPNVTGALHLGHALNNTLQDTIIRWRRMQGWNALWIPGTDHAGIATQAVVERRLKEEESKTRHDLGREQLVRRIWEWKDQYEARILGQLRQMGCSCDWERTRFTFDQVCARAVRHTFFDLFNKALIFRGKRLVNWDTFLQTAVSDDEVFNETVKGHFWHLRYPVIDPKPGEPTHVTVATTRPETMLGDTAVAVHPDPAAALDKLESELAKRLASASASDKPGIESQLDSVRQRHSTMLPALQQLAEMAADGRQIAHPLTGRTIPLIADEWAKPELGSGCVKITPAHDPNDYLVGQRAGLPRLNILNPDGTLNAHAGEAYAGLPLKEARKRVVADLDALGLLGDVEDREIELPMSDRSKTPIEPYLADQWFVRMERLAQSAIDAVEDGRIEIVPSRYARGYVDWLAEKRDWPVSRQLWWGHQIPVWSRHFADQREAERAADQIRASALFAPERASIQIEAVAVENAPERPGSGTVSRSLRSESVPDPLSWPRPAWLHVCLRDEPDPLELELESAGLVRDVDVLDTWFSSALWPHSTLGWPEATADLAYFYPTSTLITSRDIITLWVARMVLMGLNNVGQIPFDTVYIHPKILDGFGETMSKSKGNGIDPLDIIEKFGADALRFAMAHLTTETQDVRLPVQFECPHCQHAFDQTKKNRELPRVACPACNKEFSTQWARKPDDVALPRGMVTSDRFEVARNFVNKLWNAARFALMRMDGYSPAPLEPEALADSANTLAVEDRWILSRLTSVAEGVTAGLERFAFSDVAKQLYDFAWADFCSFYVEMLKDRLANPGARPTAQRMLAFVLDQLLRLLHPLMPFVTEEIWQLLAGVAPLRGFEEVETAERWLAEAKWPLLDENHKNWQLESQFASFQAVLSGIRDTRLRRNIPSKETLKFRVRCHEFKASFLRNLSKAFRALANAELTASGQDIVRDTQREHMQLISDVEILVDMTGLIDTEVELKKLERERAKLEAGLASRRAKLGNEKFVASAPPEIVQRERDGLAQLESQLAALDQALVNLQR